MKTSKGANGSRDIQRHCKRAKLLKSTETDVLEIPPRGLLIIPESDLYRLIMRSNMPDAERFQDWVMEEVLPKIRKHGGYIVGEEKMDDDELIATFNAMEKELLRLTHMRIK